MYLSRVEREHPLWSQGIVRILADNRTDFRHGPPATGTGQARPRPSGRFSPAGPARPVARA